MDLNQSLVFVDSPQIDTLIAYSDIHWDKLPKDSCHMSTVLIPPSVQGFLVQTSAHSQPEYLAERQIELETVVVEVPVEWDFAYLEEDSVQ